MEKENKKELMKIFYRNKSNLYIAIASILIAVFCLAFGTILGARKLPKAENIEDVSQEDTYSQANIYALTDYFATYNVDNSIREKYYFALGDNKIYILNLSDSEYITLDEKVNTDNNINGIVIYGMSENISNDLKNYAIESMNEIYETDEINTINFDDYFVPYLINAKKSPNDVAQIFYTIAIFAIFFGVTFGIVYAALVISTKSKIKKIAEKYDLTQISLELSNSSKLEFKITKTIFLDDYVIAYANSLEVIKYTDIIWIYPHENYVNGVKSTKQINVVTKDNKLHVISVCSAFGKNNKEEFANTYNELINRRPNVLSGYTSENINAMSKQNREETISKIIESDNSEI